MNGDMKYTVINGELAVKKVSMFSEASASVLFIGDVKMVALSSIYETPPETLIVGVTTGVVPPEPPLIPLIPVR